MNPWKLILATVVIFGAGVVVGGMLVFYTHPHNKITHRPPMVASTNRPPVTHPVDLTNLRQPELLSPSFVQKLDDALQLTPTQREAVQKIIIDGQEQNHSLWTNCTAQMRLVTQTVRQQIREQLNPEQKKQFEKLLKQSRPAPKHGPGNSPNSIPAFPATNRPPLLTDTNLAGT